MTPTGTERKSRACAAALAHLPGMTPVRLAKLLDGWPPQLCFAAVRAGAHPADRGRRFATAARRTDIDELGGRYDRAGVSVLLPGSPGYPSMLVGDAGAPAVLFSVGDPTVLEGRPRVAIVGTRSATPYGRRVASELAGELAEAGLVVVSGLALGIDAAAHAGALRVDQAATAPPVAVVGTGLDVVYPTANQALWARVASEGAVLSEAPLGTPPLPRVFPARNRIIAACSDVVVVVECHSRGGSFHTVEAAARRSIPVCVVPGSVHSPASRGSNALLAEGCTPVRDATDVLVAVSLARAGRCRAVADPGDGRGGRGSKGAVGDADLRLSTPQLAVWRAVEDTPVAFESILIRTGLSIAVVAKACDQLVTRGLLESGGGWWARADRGLLPSDRC